MKTITSILLASVFFLFSCSKNNEDISHKGKDFVQAHFKIPVMEQLSEPVDRYEIVAKVSGVQVGKLATISPTSTDEHIYEATVDISQWYNEGKNVYCYIVLYTKDGKKREHLLGNFKK